MRAARGSAKEWLAARCSPAAADPRAWEEAVAGRGAPAAFARGETQARQALWYHEVMCVCVFVRCMCECVYSKERERRGRGDM